jgi:DNA-binding XRE family transcriptional regulator
MHRERSSFAGLLMRHRLAAGLSQEELARQAGVSPRTVSDLERGEHSKPRTATVRLPCCSTAGPVYAALCNQRHGTLTDALLLKIAGRLQPKFGSSLGQTKCD